MLLDAAAVGRLKFNYAGTRWMSPDGRECLFRMARNLRNRKVNEILCMAPAKTAKRKERLRLDLFSILAEQKIKEAMDRGEFDRLEGAGEPLRLEDLSHIPEELRVGYLMLKRADMLPEAQRLKKEISTLQDLLDHCREDDGRRTELERSLSVRKLQLRRLGESRDWRNNQAAQQYEHRLKSKLEGDT